MLTLTDTQITNLAHSIRRGEVLRFTNLQNKQAVARRCTEMRIPAYSTPVTLYFLRARDAIERIEE